MTQAISTAEEYEAAKRQAIILEKSPEGTPEADEFLALTRSIQAWEEAQKALDDRPLDKFDSLDAGGPGRKG